MAGLTAAWRLDQAGADVVVFEGSDRVGGKIAGAAIGGITLDVGAESFLARWPEALGLVREVGLGDDIVHPTGRPAALLRAGTLQMLKPESRTSFASLRGGLHRLPEEIVASGRFEVRTKATVRLIERAGTQWKVAGETFDGVIVATPAPATGRILAEVAPRSAYFLAGVDYSSLAVATFVLDGADLPELSGFLVGTTETTAITAATFSTRKWDWIKTDGLDVVRASVGRQGETSLLHHRDENVLAAAQADLRAVVDLGRVEAQHLRRWGGALPHYAAGHLEIVDTVADEMATLPGLEVCGAAYRGAGIAAVIASADAAANRLLEAVR